ncbi:hypothetical protein [uncultured Pseudomonas sp.]|uniref:hypothetical protein n=1 Tax=uncultured Pseudomonas sp. TaxID=114707 RepID=UPI0025DB0E4E|nr:hypothetical protein [uncultured Pseudomonas sp.]
MRLAAAALAMTLSWTAVAETSEPTVTRWTLLDQHDKSYTLDDQAQVLLVARSMSAARLLNAAIEDQPPGYLEARRVIYVADIEMLPAVMKPVIVPAMRSANYRILLDRDGRVAGRYDGDRDTLQWLQLDKGRVVKEQRFDDGAQLVRAIAALPAP